jgi:hypothetical protein
MQVWSKQYDLSSYPYGFKGSNPLGAIKSTKSL